jgi:hydroxyethylthiazole kinase
VTLASTSTVTHATAQVLDRLRRSAPRVQCLTNTVAQAITANCLHALGVRASMATHPDEIVAMSRSADSLLVNLGTIEPVRLDALVRLLDDTELSGKPLVLDPVFVQHSPLRLAWAKRVLKRGGVIVKGNADEITALRLHFAETGCRPVAIVTTGAIDRIEAAGRNSIPIHAGHPYMAQVTGLGCAAGAVIAACAAVEPDPIAATAAAMTLFGVAGQRAAAFSAGPGSFAVHFIDELAALDAERLSESHT